MKRAISVAELLKKKFIELPLQGAWRELIGAPERSGVWIIWGDSFNGKSSFCMQLAKELARHGKINYNAMEEGARKSMQEAMLRNHMKELNGSFAITQESIDEMRERLHKRRSPEITFIDSLQYSELTKPTYKALKAEFPEKLFVFVSHAEGKFPLGRFANFVRYDADVKIRIEGYKAFCMSRLAHGISQPYTIWEEGAREYWLDYEKQK